MSFRKSMTAPPSGVDCYWLKVHGGLGDIVWVYKKAVNFDKPLFISISEENRTRPRRSGFLVDHLPNVVGWNFDGKMFCPNGQDWCPLTDPSCAYGKKFSDLNLPVNTPVRLECNKWLENGHRLDDWLPDVKTTHHFEFDPVGPSPIRLSSDYVIFHLAGWPDIPDSTWEPLVNCFAAKTDVYLVGGSYDGRPRRVYEATKKNTNVRLSEDVTFETLIGVLRGARYCFGHASGFTALADVLKVPGVVVNPRQHPLLINTWNSSEVDTQVHVQTTQQFEAAVYKAFQTLTKTPGAKWPPLNETSNDVKAVGPGAAEAAKAVVKLGARRVAFWYAGHDAPDPHVGRSVLQGAFEGGRTLESLYLFNVDATTYADAVQESYRSSVRPVISTEYGTWPGTHDYETYDLLVVQLPDNLSEALAVVNQAWTQVSYQGRMVVGCSDPHVSAGSLQALSAIIRRPIGQVLGCPGWYILSR